MVHLREYELSGDGRMKPAWDPINDYWKLNVKPSISQSSNKTPEQLHQMIEKSTKSLSRAARGLLSYKKCTEPQLRTFCKARHLDPWIWNRSQMTAALEEADETATFTKLSLLPAELRESIYQFYFLSLHTEDFPSQPPISKASRLTRQESLPIFYKSCYYAYDFRPHRLQQTGTRVQKMLQHGPATALAHICDLWLVGTTPVGRVVRWGRHNVRCQVSCSMWIFRDLRVVVRPETIPERETKLVVDELVARRQALLRIFRKRGERLELRPGDRELFELFFDRIGGGSDGRRLTTIVA